MIRQPRLPAFLLLAIGLLPTPGAAQAVRSVSISADNDGFVFLTPREKRSDRYYTHGLRTQATLSWIPPWIRVLSSAEPGLCGRSSSDDSCLVTRISLGQKIFTPGFIFDEDPRNHDRPYAGWLYLSAHSARITGNQRRSLGLEIGVTGEPSLAGTTHRWFHRSLEKHEPLGWEHQIPFEPAFLVRFAQHRLFSPLPPLGPGTVELEPRFAVSGGTLRTGISGGLALHGGWNAPRSREWREGENRGFFLRLTLDAEGEMVARDLFLDGSTFGSSIHTERALWVGRLRGRIQMGWSRVAVEFRATRSTPEFQSQDGRHTYGTLRLMISS